ncbi:hypothetical protein EST38_g7527 [Candolleomyces aberdarensis]|uniref:F-box domain-containing protein n=1 Tax=Candolleomyces aberdarensis TaxID=2316362 RepID=A0A4Q2DEX6_9AGAR|nr:hypothetical protein EST38_g7527 [Candolleomyces aberdarensis]
MDSDLERLFYSNIAPSEHQETILLQSISSLDGSMAQIDDELALARRALEELSFQKSILRETRNACVCIMSPLRRLPVDLWIEIMKFAVWSSTTPPRPHVYFPSSSRWSTDVSSILPRSGSLSHVSFADLAEELRNWPESRQLSVLTRVCKGWQSLLLSTGVFWCSLELHVYANDRGLDEFAPRLERWFKRSGGLPWSLKLISSRRHLHAPRFASFIGRNSFKWKSLKFYMQDLDVLGPLFYLGEAGTRKGNGSLVTPKQESCARPWSQLEVFWLDGWATGGAKVKPWSRLNDTLRHPGAPLRIPRVLYMHGAMPSLTSLILDMPCQKVSKWSWVPWVQIADLDLKTGDSYQDIVTILSNCSDALITCSVVFASPREPPPIAIVPDALPPHHPSHDTFDDSETDTSDDEDDPFIEPGNGYDDSEDLGDNGSVMGSLEVVAGNSSGLDNNQKDFHIRLTGLKELTLKKITYVGPLLSRLTLPSIRRLVIMVSPVTEPEPYLGETFIDFLDRSSPSAASISGPLARDGTHDMARRYSVTNGPPLTYLNLCFENTRFRRMEAPLITDVEYLQIFERVEKLRTLHLKDYSTRAMFLEKLNGRGLLPRLTTISFVVDAITERMVPGRFDDFVRTRSDTFRMKAKEVVRPVYD